MRNKVSYLDKEVFIGIDVHRGNYTVSAVISGTQVDKFSYKGTEDNFLLVLLTRYRAAKEIICCYEAGFSGYGLQRKLEVSGFKCMIVHPGFVAVNSQKRKTDKRDAKSMSIQLYSGELRGIYIPRVEEEDIRRHCRLRSNLIKDRTRMRTRIRMLFNYYGILPLEVRTPLSYLAAQRIYISNLSKFGEGFKEEIGCYLDLWQVLAVKIKAVDKTLKELSAKSEFDQYYLSVPGFGLLLSRLIASELGDMSRFSNIKKAYSYTGLTPSEHTTGEARRLGHISREGKPILRAKLIQAAWRAIDNDKSLAKFYNELKIRRGGKRAIVAVARKLLGIARYCAMNKKLYKVPKSEELDLAA
jgi:transposase